MRKKVIIAAAVSILSITLLCSLGYRGITAYMQNRFAPNTWVDGVYCTGMTVDEVNQMLLLDCEAPVITVEDAKGETYELDMSKADYSFDYSKTLTAYQVHQVKNGWLSMASKENQISKGSPDVDYNEDRIKEWWSELPIVMAEAKEPTYKLILKNDGYQIKSTLKGHLDTEKGLTELVDTVSQRGEYLSLKDTDCYFDYELDIEQERTLSDYNKLKAMEQCGLTYDMGAEKIVFDEELMCSFIAKNTLGEPMRNENGEFYYDLNVVTDYVETLCEQYHTYGVDRPFNASRGEIVMVPAGTYGTEIDVKAEIQFLTEYLSDDELRLTETIHTPVYLHETAVKGLNDIGPTYIEVDMTEQMIYFYKDGELMVSSGVVTGNLRTKHGTPAGAYYIYGKARNRVLRGPGYASFVRRWMPVVRSIGLHDANWRKEFGGEIYKRDGSHGCVNMPDETTDIIYDNAEIGTPVLIFY